MRFTMSRWLLSAALLALAAVSALAAGRGMLGVTTQSTDEDLRRGLDLTRDGLLVNQVAENSPADRAGLRKGDVILTYDSRTVTEPGELRELVRDTEPGRNIALGIWRDGARRTLEVTVGELPTADEDTERFDVPTPAPSPRAPRAPRAPAAPRTPRYDGYGRGDQGEQGEQGDNSGDHGDIHRRIIINGKEVSQKDIERKLKELEKQGGRLSPGNRLEGLEGQEGLEGMRHFEGFAPMPGGNMFFTPSGRGRLGVRVEKLNDDLAQALGAAGDKGVLVVEVIEDTPAQKAGLRAGDVIVRVGTRDVDSPDEMVKALAGRDAGNVDLTIVRKGARREIQAELDSRGEGIARGRNLVGRPDRVRIVEPGRGNQVYRWNTKDGTGNDGAGEDDDLREELRQLKQELRELRDQLKEKK